MASRSLGTLTIDVVAKTAGLEKGMDRTERRVKNAERSIKNLSRSLKGFGAAIAGAFSVAVVRDIVEAGLQMERFERSLKVATGSANAAAREMQFVTKVSNDLGLSLTETTGAYSKLAAAARGTALQGEASREIFIGIAEASAALGLTAEQTGGALTAIEQIISKGKVSAEELRGQLGERLPGAFQIAARSIGVTTSELDEMLKKGELLSEDLLPAFAAELRKTFGDDAIEAADSAQGAFNRLNNAIVQIKASIADSGLTEILAEIAERAANVLGPDQQSSLQKVAADLGEAYKRLANARASGAVQDIALLEQEVSLLRAKFTELQAIERIQKSTGSRDTAGAFAALGSVAATSKDLDAFFEKQLADYGKDLDAFASRFSTAEEKAASMREELNRFRDDLSAGQIATAEGSIFEVLTGGLEEVEANFDHLRERAAEFHDGAIAKAAAAREQELEGVRQFLMDREEIEAEAYQRRSEILLANMDAGSERDALLLENAQRYADALVALEEHKQAQISAAVLQGIHTRDQFEKASSKDQVKSVLGTLTQITAGVAAHDKRMFALNKAASIANAIINTAEGVTKALEAYPPPLSFAMAAAQAAAGAAQIAAIRATSFGSGTTPSVVGSTPTLNGQPVTQTSPEPVARERQTIIEIRVEGSILTDDALVKKLGDVFDSDAVIIGPNSRQAATIRGSG